MCPNCGFEGWDPAHPHSAAYFPDKYDTSCPECHCCSTGMSCIGTWSGDSTDPSHWDRPGSTLDDAIDSVWSNV